ncbi:MAG: hypothetical protein HY711_05875 [Candidatus Melainabacteria bacterium]|nr:hypothetical protein [Candidatus Melainabacteria bacterium]
MHTFLFPFPDLPTRAILERSVAWLDEHEIDIVYADSELTHENGLCLPEYTELDAIVKILASTKCDGIIAQTEYGLLPSAILCKQMGLPGISPEAAMLCTNKWLCREVLAQHGLPMPRYALAESLSDVRAFGLFPMVLKGVATTLGRNVVMVHGPDELEDKISELKSRIANAPDIIRLKAFARITGLDLGCDPARQFLVEEYIDDIPLETDGLVFDDTIESFGVTEQLLTAPPNFYLEGYLLPADDAPNVEAVTIKALGAIGLKHAGFSIEFRGLKLIEINARLGEDDGFPELFKTVRGEYAILDWLSYLKYGQATQRQSQCYAALAYVNCYQAGIVRDLPVAPEGVTIVARTGQVMFAAPHPDIAPHLAYAISTHPSSSQKAYLSARSKIDKISFVIG